VNAPGGWVTGCILLACALFCALGLAFVPHAGVQLDEALFASPLYNPPDESRAVRILGRSYQLMLLNYLGTVKTWIYAPLFKRWKPSVHSLRVPVILFGALSVWLLGRLLLRVSGPRAALAGCFLLATDTTYLLTTVFDWGPVALQHLLMLAALLLLVRFHASGSLSGLGAAFLCFGLAMWDKALFAWMLSGIAAGGLVAFPREIRNAVSLRTVVVAACAFVLGASPFLLYNIQHSSESVGEHLVFTFQDLRGKWDALVSAADGSTLFGYIAADDAAGKPRRPEGVLERASVALSAWAGEPRESLMPAAYLLALVLGVVFLRSQVRRPILFSIIVIAVAWGQMALTRNAGGAAHHTVLLWPMPAFLAAIVFAEASKRLPPKSARTALASLVAVLCVSNLAVINQHHAQLVRNGASTVWTDAIMKLPQALRRAHASAIFATDWGMIDNLLLLSRGGLPMRVGGDSLKEAPQPEDWAAVRQQLSGEGHVFLAWVDGREVTPGKNARLHRMSAQLGYELEVVEIVADRNGRPAFQVLRPRRRERIF